MHRPTFALVLLRHFTVCHFPVCHFPVRHFPVRYFPVLQIPPLRLRPSFSSPANSSPANSAIPLAAAPGRSMRGGAKLPHKKYILSFRLTNTKVSLTKFVERANSQWKFGLSASHARDDFILYSTLFTISGREKQQDIHTHTYTHAHTH